MNQIDLSIYKRRDFKLKNIKITIILLCSLLFTVVMPIFSQENGDSTKAVAYKINGVKEFHSRIKDFVKSSEEGIIEKLKPENILDKTVYLSRVVIMVDNLSDEDYFQVVYNAIVSYKEFLFENDSFNTEEKKLSEIVLSYLSDLEMDLVNQNKENISDTGTKAFRFDIGNFKGDDSSNYDMKQEILNQGPKTAKRYIPFFTTIDEQLIDKFNSVGIDTLRMTQLKDLPASMVTSLIKFKGKKILLPAIKNIDNESLKILADFKNEIEFEKLEVTDKNIMILSTFKASELRIKGLPKKYNKMIKKKLGKRYKRKINFKKMKK